MSVSSASPDRPSSVAITELGPLPTPIVGATVAVHASITVTAADCRFATYTRDDTCAVRHRGTRAELYHHFVAPQSGIQRIRVLSQKTDGTKCRGALVPRSEEARTVVRRLLVGHNAKCRLFLSENARFSTKAA
jgi:hypothetical protein